MTFFLTNINIKLPKKVRINTKTILNKNFTQNYDII